jgi:hypothetical protein
MSFENYNKVLMIKTGNLDNLDKITEMKSDHLNEEEKIEIKKNIQNIGSLYRLKSIFQTHTCGDYNTIHNIFLNNVRLSSMKYFNNSMEVGVYPINENENYIIIKDGEEKSQFNLK